MEREWQYTEPVGDVDMKELLAVLLRRAWLIILSAVVCAGVAYGGAKVLVTPQYQSSVLFYVNNASISADGLISSLVKEELDVAKQMVETYGVILNTRKTLDDVLAAAKIDADPEQLRKHIELADRMTLERVEATELFRVHVTWEDPEQARTIANALAEVLPARIAEIIDDTSARIVDSAVLPSKPIRPNLKNCLVLGGLLGVVMSAGWMALRYMYDSKIRSVTALNRYGNLPVLAVIPELGKHKG